MIKHNVVEILLLCLGQVLDSPRDSNKNYNLWLLPSGIDAALAQIWCSETTNHHVSEMTAGRDFNLLVSIHFYSDILLNHTEFYLTLFCQLTCLFFLSFPTKADGLMHKCSWAVKLN